MLKAQPVLLLLLLLHAFDAGYNYCFHPVQCFVEYVKLAVSLRMNNIYTRYGNLLE